MKTKIKLTIVFLLITMLSFSQKGVINNGAKIVITSGAVLDIEGGADADYTNQSYNSSNHGRIDLDGKIKITGNWTNNANAGNNVLINMDTDGLILFNGSATQTIGGSTASYFEKFTLDNSSGALLGSEAKINGVFTLTNGLMTIGANNLLLGTSASIAGTPSASKMVVATGTGQLIKYYSSTGSFTFPVGDNTGTAEYSPLILNFISGTFGGSAYAAVNLSDLKHAQNSSSTDYITRYWSVDQYNISSFSCDLTATYLTVDIAGTESNLYSAQYDAPYWNILNAVNTSNNEISGTVSTFSDFTAAEQNAVSVLISIADDATLNESAEDGELITVTLSNDDFVGSLNSTNWTVTNLPEGVTKGTITRTGDKTATIALVGNRTKDYDTDITNLTVNIAHNEFVNMSSGSVEDDFGVTFNATNDDESISMTDDGITEGAEDGEIITVTAVNGTFATSITPANWTLTNMPAGVSKGAVTRIDELTVEITLSGNTSEDYDVDITNCTLEITDSEIDDYSGANLSVNTGVTFTAIDEPLTISMDEDGDGIAEGAENTEVIRVTITGKVFHTPLTPANWIVTNLPEGVTKSDVTRINDLEADITLSGNRTKDYDSDITNVTVQIAVGEIDGHTSVAIVNTGVEIIANNDAESIAISDDGINEGSEDTEVITVDLTGGTFVNTLTPSNWTITNLPVGVTAGNPSRVSSTQATITLSGNRTVDYDASITNFTVSIDATEIDDHTGAAISDNTGVTFIANNDSESISMTDDGITEGAEDGEIITVTAVNGTFATSITPANWTLTNMPAGVSKGAVTRIDELTVEITLSGNTSEDYDVDITNCTLEITDSEIDDYSGANLSVNTGVVFIAIDESLTISMDEDGDGIAEGAENTEVVRVTIASKVFHDPLTPANWTVTNLPEGVTKSNVIRIGDLEADIILSGNRTKDYDSDITNVTVQIAVGEIDGYESVAIVNTGVEIIANNDAESIAISDDGINEGSEDTEVITVDLTGGTFVNTLTPSNWTITNLPEGVTAGNPSRVSSTQATITLSGNRIVDYDANITNLTVSVDAAEIDDHTGAAISDNTGVTFIANNDSESISMTDNGITEGAEDGAIITVTAVNGTFATSITPANWTLTNMPAGVSKGAVTRIDELTVEITLSGNTSEDYDVDITNCTLEITDTEIDDYSGANLSVNTGVVFIAIDESLTISMDEDGDGIAEGAENTEVIRVTITGKAFHDPLTPANWTVTNLPEGVTKSDVTRINDLEADITLSGNRTKDYDSDITNVTVQIAVGEIDGYASVVIMNSGVEIIANNDAESIAISDDGINEGSEDTEVITVDLTGGTFVNTLTPSNWTITNLPEGVTAGNPSRVSSTQATITLSGNRTVDYDASITNFTVSIDPAEIDDHSGTAISDNTGVTFIANNDSESIAITDDGITEGAEDGEIITVALTGGTYVSSLIQGNWTLTNLPDGVTQGTVTRVNSSSATIVLIGNRTVDYDADITDLTLNITDAEIDDHTGGDIIDNTGVTFTAIDEPVTITISDDGIFESVEDGEFITVYLEEDEFVGTLTQGNWTLSNLPGGITKGTVTRISNDSATIQLLGNRIVDYDTDIENVTVTILGAELTQHTGSPVSANTGVVLTATDDDESISITDNGITEGSENGEVITVTVSGGTLVDPINSGLWVLTNLPDGVSKGTVLRTGNNTATITLSGNASEDYDVDITNCTLEITDSEIDDYSGANLSVNTGVTFIAIVEPVEVTLAYDGEILEEAENGNLIYVKIINDDFVGTLTPANWTVNNLPEGVTKGTITRVGNDTATIQLSGNRTVDYDSDINNVEVIISGAEFVVQSNSASANTGVTLTADDDTETILMADDGEILEGAENGEVITITLGGGTFVNSLNSFNWSLTNNPDGVSVASVSRISSTLVELTLNGVRTTDYDVNITNMILSINADEIDDHSGVDITQNAGVTFNANDESCSIAHAGLTENNLDGAEIQLLLVDETFQDATLEITNFVLNNAPTGTSVDFVTYIDNDSAVVTLYFNGTDFDTDITDFNITVNQNELFGVADITSNDLTITAVIEDVTISISDDGIFEGAEDGELIYVTVSEDEFVGTLTPGNWTLTNLPVGITKGTITRTDATNATIALTGNRTVDYDSDIENLTVEITGDEFVIQSITASANTGVIFITDNDGESITISDDGINEGAENNEIISVVLTGGTFVSSLTQGNWTLSNLPNGVTKGTVTRVNSNSATIVLIGNSIVDYDNNIENMTLSISNTEIDDHDGSNISINTGVVFVAVNDDESIAMTDDGITEGAEDGEIISVVLTGGTFVGSLNEINWTLSNLPEGVSKGTITRIDANNVTIALSGNCTEDYDVNIENMELIIFGEEIDDFSGTSISITTGVIFTALDEIATISHAGLTEENLDGANITLGLTNDSFVDGTLNIANFTLNDVPQGVTINDVLYVNSTNGTIILSFDGTDFDSDYSDFSITVNAAELVGLTDLTSDSLLITATNDDESIAMADDGEILEGAEDGEIITVTLTGGTFTESLNTNNWTLSNLPVGVTKGTVARTDATHVSITLNGNSTADYDVNITNMTISVLENEVNDYTGDALSISTGVVFIANDELLTIYNSSLDESNLDGAVINLSLTNETFADVTLDVGNFVLNNAPIGTSVNAVNYVNPDSATITLAFDGSDFDEEISNFNITTNANELSGSGDLTSNDLTITAVIESETATISHSGLTEENLNGAEINLTLTNETFVDGTLESTNFLLVNTPEGSSVSLVSYISSTEAVITVAFDGTDFDSDIADFRITVLADELSAGASITSNNLAITATNDAEVLTMSDDGEILEGAENGEVISVSLTGGTFISLLDINNWSLSNMPDGVTIGSVNKINSTNVEIVLSGNTTINYDVDITNTLLSVYYEEINDFTSGYLTVDEGVTFTAILDKEVLIDHPGLNEGNLNGAEITLLLINETFADATLDVSNFILNNAPLGTSVNAVNYIDADNATITLAFDGSDFDEDISDFNITIIADELSAAGELTSNELTIIAVIESETATISHAGLTEENLNGAEINLTLTNETFVDGTLENTNFLLVNSPEGSSVSLVSYISSTEAVITVAFDGTDFDTDIADFRITVLSDELSAGASITSNNLTITATDDAEVLTMSDDGEILEGAEEGEVISVVLEGGTFTGTLNSDNWTLTNLPEGVTKGAVSKIDATHVTITLTGNTTVDYDVDITDMTLAIAENEINDHTGDSITVNTGVIFVAIIEPVDTTVTISHAGLTEENLDGAEINLTITNETFADETLENANFLLVNAPVGSSVSLVSYISSTEALITVAFDGTDFDTDSTDFRITVLTDELSADTSITSNNLTIIATDDDESITITDDGITEGAEDGEVISVVLEGGTFTGTLNPDNWTLTNLPVGVTKGTVTREKSDSATIVLIGNRTIDYDSNIENITLSISNTEIDDHDGSDISVNTGVIFVAVNDDESIIITDDGITEGAEDGEVISVVLDGGTFTGTLNPDNWTLTNLPEGVTKGAVSKIDATHVTITLTGNTTVDYDVDITDMTLAITENEINDHTGDDIAVNTGVVFVAIIETEDTAVTISHTGLTELNLDGADISLSIQGDEFVDNEILPENFVLVNAPLGTSVEAVAYINSTEAVVILAFDGTDFDEDVVDFKITILAAELNGATDITSNELTITAIVEEAVLTIYHQGLNQANLDSVQLLVTLANETFIDSTLEISNIILNNIPTGTSVETIEYTSDTLALLDLAFDGPLFEEDYTNFSITILQTELSGTWDLTSNELTIFALPNFISEMDNEINAIIYSYNDKIYIKIENNISKEIEGNVVVFNIYGQEILRKKLENDEINVIKINSVTNEYFVRVYVNGKAFIQKVYLEVK